MEFSFTVHVDKTQEGTYFLVPFDVPAGAVRLDLQYEYPRVQTEHGPDGERVTERNIIDLALCAGDGKYLGSSGADRDEIFVGPAHASPGYAPHPIDPGSWAVVVGAYRIASEGVDVTYTVTLTMAARRLFKGDLHMHTTGSDGDRTPAELVRTAEYLGLDFIFLTDHNNFTQNLNLPASDTVTVLPGMEWTHFYGHANMLGVSKPLPGVYFANSTAETAEKLRTAQENGALVSINHPFCPSCGWRWGLDGMPYDCIEIVNGLTTAQANADCLDWWQAQLAAGRRIPVVGGSDYHTGGFGREIGVPTTCVYANSSGKSDILNALRQGHGYVACHPNAPEICLTYGAQIMGDVVCAREAEISVACRNCGPEDTVHILTARGGILCVPSLGRTNFTLHVHVTASDRFCRAEVVRPAPQLGVHVHAVITNPIYLEADDENS